MRSLAQGQDWPIEIREGWTSDFFKTFKRFTPQSWSERIKPWRAPASPPIYAMLLALQTATESYLEGSINTTDIVLPTPPSDPNRGVLDQEISRLGLRRTHRFISALEATLYANQVSRRERWPPFSGRGETRLILAIDYSRSALTASLWIDEDGDFLDEYRLLTDIDIGADALPSDDRSTKRHQLLKDVASLPVTVPEHTNLTEISEIVIIGDRAIDDEFLRLLEETAGTGLVTKMKNATRYDFAGDADHVFTAVKSIAYLAKQKIDEGEQTCLAWDCNGLWDEWMGL